MTDVATAAPAVKSIVNPKYRDKYKKAEAKDWLSRMLDEQASKTRTVTVTKPNPDNADEKITTTETRPDGVDVDKLFTIAKNNGIETAGLEAQRANHGFAGRARMTIANGLRRVIKERHGLFNVSGTFVEAPAEMLTKVGADAEPTHNQDGSKVAKAKPAETVAEAPAAAEKPKAARGKKAGTEEA